MKRCLAALLVGASVCSTAIAAPTTAMGAASAGPPIHVDDVYRFYRLYDAAQGHPGAERLQREYLDPGSEGLHHLAKIRKVTGEAIAKSIETRPEAYAEAKRCMAVLPRVRERLAVALGELARRYPALEMAPSTVAVSRGKPVAVTDAQGVIVGLEALCGVQYLEANLEDRFVHVMVHEYAHVQQARKAAALVDAPQYTVLQGSLLEGSAEFVTELITGSVAYVGLPAMAKGREKELETAFLADQDKTDLSDWLYNGTLTKPGDLGYWVGYRIAKAYYANAKDKSRALREILEMTDAKAFLAASGWSPGMRLPESKD